MIHAGGGVTNATATDEESDAGVLGLQGAHGHETEPLGSVSSGAALVVELLSLTINLGAAIGGAIVGLL